MAVDYTGCACGGAGSGGSDCITCQTIQLCDTVTTGGTNPETPERIVNGNFATGTAASGGTPSTAPPWALTPGAAWLPAAGQDGQAGFIDFSPGNGAAGAIEQTVTVTPGLTYNLTALLGTWDTGGNVPQSITVEVRDGAGTLLFGQTYNPAVVPGQRVWNLNIDSGPIPATDGTMTVRFIDNAGGDFTDVLVDNVSLLGPGSPGTGGTTEVVPFLHTVCRNCDGTIASQTDTELDGTTPFVHDPSAVTGICTSPAAEECARQVVERCGCDDVNGDGSVINRYIELWAVDPCTSNPPELVGTWLDGDFDQPYTPTNPIDCPPDPDCLKCDTHQLCDIGGPAHIDFTAAPVPAPGSTGGTLSNGVTWSAVGAGGPWQDDWWPIGVFPAPSNGPLNFTFSQPVTLTYGARVGRQFTDPTTGEVTNTGTAADGSIVMPAGVRLVSLDPSHAWNASTRTLSAQPGSDSGNLTAVSRFALDDPITAASFTTAPGITGSHSSLRWVGDFTVTPAPVPFLRTFCRDCDGVAQPPVDTALDGSAYTVVGTVGRCPDTESPACQNCETLILCDAAGDDEATIRGLGVSSGTLPNGVAWTSTGRNAAANYTGPVTTRTDNSDGGWWGASESFPLTSVAPYTWTYSSPSVVEFSVYMAYDPAAAQPDDNCTQLPPNVEVVDLPTGYVYDPVTSRVCVTAEQDPAGTCTDIANPSRPVSARFRTNGPVSTMTITFLGVRRAMCGSFQTYRVGAFEVTPTGQFMRRICRDCDGATISVTDTLLDGTTPYIPRGGVVMCDPEPACCQPVQVCVTPRETGEVQFVSNPRRFDDGSVADTWTWAPASGNPSTVATWYPMYNKWFGAAWSATDSPTRADGSINSPTAYWVCPHPDARISNTGRAGEGPTLANPGNWWARAEFNLPAAADPDSIRVEITVLNADQVPNRYRLNDGPWINGGGAYNGTRYTQPPQTVTGAQAGTNFLYFEVNENAAVTPANNGAGVMAHFILTYEIAGQASWTQMVCCDGDTWYLDNLGNRHESLPDSYAIVPCSQAVPITLCDDNGTFIRWTQDLAGEVTVKDTDLNGGDYSPSGTVHDCASTPTTNNDAPVLTGVRRLTNSTVAQNLATEFPGLQSVTLTVIGGSVNATMTTGTSVSVPAGVTQTWSVSGDNDDSVLGVASFAGAATSDYLLNFTYKSTNAG